MFDGPRLKIKRADHHIEKLNNVVRDYIQSDFYSLGIEKNPDGGNVFRFKQIKALPEEIPLLIGDAIHNLRSALDLLACEIVTTAGGAPSRWTHFPIRDSRKEVEDAIKGGEIKIAGSDIIALILDSIQPYKGGNDFLSALHNLDIIDKHRLLIPIASITGLTEVNAKVGGIAFTNCQFVISDGGVLNVVGLPPGDVQFEGHGKPVFAILFSHGQPFQGKAVIPTLHQLSQIVTGIIETIEKAYLARSQSNR